MLCHDSFLPQVLRTGYPCLLSSPDTLCTLSLVLIGHSLLALTLRILEHVPFNLKAEIGNVK